MHFFLFPMLASDGMAWHGMGERGGAGAGRMERSWKMK